MNKKTRDYRWGLREGLRIFRIHSGFLCRMHRANERRTQRRYAYRSLNGIIRHSLQHQRKMRLFTAEELSPDYLPF